MWDVLAVLGLFAVGMLCAVSLFAPANPAVYTRKLRARRDAERRAIRLNRRAQRTSARR